MAFGLSACASIRIAPPLGGVRSAVALPATRLPDRHRRTVFTWEYREKIFSARGEGVARIAPPDSVRLDFFLQNGAAGGAVIMIGDSLFAPAQDEATRYLPPVTLLWASLGRLTATAPDTVVAIDGDTLRADIGEHPRWRVAFRDGWLARVEHVEDGRVTEYAVRRDSLHVEYHHARPARTLRLAIIRHLEESAFDATIWRR
ncbi:MAG: hypothetical protein MNPFHGCM_01495 [Gemmatimonadaceae bacterium]|nr:hypothetical protein [Gemmatimonadaceae bacterium]